MFSQTNLILFGKEKQVRGSCVQNISKQFEKEANLPLGHIPFNKAVVDKVDKDTD